MAKDSKVYEMAEKLLFDLTQLPGDPGVREIVLGRALFRFLGERRNLCVDALLDQLVPR